MHPSVSHIQSVVASYFDIPVGEMTSARQWRGVARIRQIAMALAIELTPYSLAQIGRRFGDRDRTTVRHARNVVDRLIASDPEFARAIDQIRGKI